MANRIKRKNVSKSSFQENTALIMGIFTLVVLCIMPLVFHNYYFDILETKYQFYCAAAIGMMVIMGGYGLASGQLFKAVKEIDIRKLIKSLNATDWAMLAFWMSNVISWLLCPDWKWDAFWGTLGRYNGVFLMTIYMIVYFLTTRFFHFRKWYLDAFLAVGIFVSLFGITDYFQMDILGFKVNMVEVQKSMYTSTFGNINTYSIYIGALLVVSTILFSQEKNQKRMAWYYANMVLSAIALIMSISDSSYLTIAALFGAAPIYLFRTKSGLRRYMISLATFFSVLMFVGWIDVQYVNGILTKSSVVGVITGIRIFPLLVLLLWIITAVIIFVTLKKSETNEIGKWLRNVWIAFLVLAIAGACFVLYDANAGGHADRYQAIRNYVVFNDTWGTNRGFVWIRCMRLFNERFTLLQKLFGYGPETFMVLMKIYFDREMMEMTFDNAHNEYLHYLVTIGLAGMISYIAFLVSSIVRMAKTMKHRPEVAAILFAIVAYMVQAAVNLNLPVVMPIILQLILMGVSRKMEGAGQ